MEAELAEQTTYADIIVMTRWMVEQDFTPDEIAYAVEKPHKHLDYIRRAAAGLPSAE